MPERAFWLANKPRSHLSPSQGLRQESGSLSQQFLLPSPWPKLLHVAALNERVHRKYFLLSTWLLEAKDRVGARAGSENRAGPETQQGWGPFRAGSGPGRGWVQL